MNCRASTDIRFDKVTAYFDQGMKGKNYISMDRRREIVARGDRYLFFECSHEIFYTHKFTLILTHKEGASGKYFPDAPSLTGKFLDNREIDAGLFDQ